MGSGSDYSSFIQHLGIPSLNIGYGGEGEGGEYHSIYDSYDMYRRFKDPTYLYLNKFLFLFHISNHLSITLKNILTLAPPC